MMEYATTQPAGAQPRQPLTRAIRATLRGTCSCCQTRAVLGRTVNGKLTAFCARHAKSERIDRQISKQLAVAATMRSKRK